MVLLLVVFFSVPQKLNARDFCMMVGMAFRGICSKFRFMKKELLQARALGAMCKREREGRF